MERGANRANHLRTSRQRRPAAADSACDCRKNSAAFRRMPCRWSRRPSICRAPKCTASSPFIMTSVRTLGRHVLKLCRAEACQAAGGDALAARAEDAARRRRSARRRPTAASRSSRFIASASARYRPRPCSTASIVGRLDEKKLDALLAEATDERAAHLRSAETPLRSPAVPTRSRPRSRLRRQSARSISRSSATVRAACTGWSRWWKSRPTKGRIAYGPVELGDVEACSTR